MMVPMMVMMMMTMVTMVTMLLLSSILLRDSSSIHPFIVNAQSTTTSDDTSPIIIDTNDGPGNLREGRRLFHLHQYNAASHHLWRAIILHTEGVNSKLYEVEEVFTPFLQCYLLQDKLLDGLTFIAAESYLRGEANIGSIYVEKALEKDGAFGGALELKKVMRAAEYDARNERNGRENAVRQSNREWKMTRLKEIRNRYDLSKSKQQQQQQQQFPPQIQVEDDDGVRRETLFFQSDNNDNDDTTTTAREYYTAVSLTSPLAEKYADKSPEDIYNIGTVYYNMKEYARASDIFELSCQESNRELSEACSMI